MKHVRFIACLSGKAATDNERRMRELMHKPWLSPQMAEELRIRIKAHLAAEEKR